MTNTHGSAMTGPEARDDEREALVRALEGARTQQTFDEPLWETLADALIAAGYRKQECIWREGWMAGWLNRHQAQPDPDGTYGVSAPVEYPYVGATAISECICPLRGCDAHEAKHPEPAIPKTVAMICRSRQSGRTSQMIDALLTRASEHGIAVKIIESEHPEPEITDEMVEAGARERYYHEDGFSPWEALEPGYRASLLISERIALEAALRLPVRGGEQ